MHYPETPGYFDSEIRPPDQMGYHELKGYIEEMNESGQPEPELLVSLYQKVAYPVISLVMALVALPFAFRLGRQGALYGVGLSVILGFVFMAIFAFFTKLGEAGALPALVAVWSPGTVFASGPEAGGGLQRPRQREAGGRLAARRLRSRRPQRAGTKWSAGL